MSEESKKFGQGPDGTIVIKIGPDVLTPFGSNENKAESESLMDSQIPPQQVSNERLPFYRQAAEKFKEQEVSVEVLGEEFPDGRRAQEGHVVIKISPSQMGGKMGPFYAETDRLQEEAAKQKPE